MLLLAHRGLRGPDRPENTTDAVAAARAAGADGCEVDLRLTADGDLLASHDDTLDRVAGCPLRVSDTRTAALRALTLPGGARLALPEELVEAAAGGPVVLEVKRPPERPGAVEQTVRALDGVLDRLPRGLELTVSSFDPRLVAGARRLRRPVRTALLGRRGVAPRGLMARGLLAGHDQVHPHVTALVADARAVGLARRLALDVVAWTVNAPADARLLAGCGVVAAITDDPVGLRRALAPVPALAAR